MKSKTLSVKREEWEKLREFRKAPFKKRYYEIIKMVNLEEVNFI
jgi:hypothetical protein